MNTTVENYFIVMCLLFPGDAGWGPWTNWTECTKSCGGGVRSRRRECNSPSPEGKGNYCEGLGTAFTACNTDHCPGTLTVNVCASTFALCSRSSRCTVSPCVCWQWRHARGCQAPCSAVVVRPARAPVTIWP